MKNISPKLLILVACCAAGSVSMASTPTDGDSTKTVLGPRNGPLADGAEALKRRDAERGVELTLEGLRIAQGRRERQAALSNLCAGYVLLGDYQTALNYCNQALAENDHNWRSYSNRALTYLRLGRHEEAAADVERGQALAPNARSLKEVKGLLLDETEPVAPTIVIDDRREQPDGAPQGDGQDIEKDNE